MGRTGSSREGKAKEFWRRRQELGNIGMSKQGTGRSWGGQK